ncbi:2-C-methyl-D-erythritol 4-phosphate cytidylyltransferase, partial [bacterium]
ACSGKSEKILFHDGVRPFVSDRIITECIEKLNLYNAVNTAVPSTDTLIEINDKMIVTDIPDRNKIYRVQTPQGFKYNVILQAHERAKNDNSINFTDDCGLIFSYKLGEIFVVQGEQNNIKITYKQDLKIAEKILNYKNSHGV